MRFSKMSSSMNWSTLYTTTTGDGNIDIVNNLSVSTRYVRMRATVSSLFGTYSLNEMEVFSPEMNCQPSVVTSLQLTPSDKKANLNLWPNPAKTKLSIEAPFNFNTKTAELFIYTVSGKLFFTQTTSSHLTEIELKDYPSSIYYVVIKINNEIYSGKFIKLE